MEELFEAVRAACSATTWSRGVNLVRASAVRAEGAGDGDEIAVRVGGGRGPVAPLVTLHPDDSDWECDCASAQDPCEHVAAAVIALRRSGGRPDALPSSGAGDAAGGRIGYRLERSEGGLALERVVVANGQPVTLRSTLAALASGRVDGPRVTATSADVDVERALGPRLRGRIPRGALPRILEGLSRCDDVQLDGRPVRVSTEPAEPRGRVERVPEGWRVRVLRDPAVEEVLDDVVAVCGDVLRPLGRAELSGREREELPRGRIYADDRLTELVTEVIPSLARRVRLELPADGLPQAEHVPPRTRVEVSRDGDRLSLLPTLVYGDPVCARVDAGRLVHLRGPVPVRDASAESRAVRALERALGLTPGRRVTLGGEAALDLAERLRAWPGEVYGDALESFRRVGPLRARIETGMDSASETTGWSPSFDVHFTVEPGPNDPRSGPDEPAARRADPARVLRAWREGASLVALDGGGFAPLPTDWLSRFGERVADLLAARDRDKRLPPCSLPDLARLCDASGLERPRGDAVARIAALADGFDGLPPLAPGDLPDDLAAELRDYQREGVRWLRFLRDAGLGALLADDMGLGKTLQALCAVRGRTLVVAPTSVVSNWLDEIARFRPGLRAALYHGPARALDPEADVTVTSYALLRLDVERLARVEWDGVVLDEAQAIKNPDSQVARAAFRLRSAYRFTLTGTPVENRLDELWSQLRFLNPGLLGDRRDFDERYGRPIARAAGPEAGAPAGEGRAAAERLRERIRPFVLRRLKRDVAPELPPRTEMVLHCSLDEEERAVYEAVRAATRRDVLRQLEAGGGVLEALEALLRLRQAACHGGLVPGQRLERSSKLELLQEQLDEAVSEGHRALVFSQWTSLLDRVEPVLERAGIAYSRLDGSTRDRAGVVRDFQSETGPPVLLVSLKAGGSGLNLTAADHVFLLDPWWNPAAEDQAADRAHRIGQDKPVFVHRLVAENTVEEHILALQTEKRRLAEAALGSPETAAAMAGGASLTRDDLLALLS